MKLSWRLRTQVGEDIMVLQRWAKTSTDEDAHAIPFAELDWLLGPFGVGRAAVLELHRAVDGLGGASSPWGGDKISPEALFALKEAFRSGRLVAFKVPNVVARGPFPWSFPLPPDAKLADSVPEDPAEPEDWPTLAIQEIRYDTIPVVMDGVDDIGKLFPCQWNKGNARQPPLCCPAGTALALEADFNVVTKVDAVVKLKAVAQLGTGAMLTWYSEVKVQSGQTSAGFGFTPSNEALPPGVAIHDPLKIEWSMSDRSGRAWLPIGSTAQTLYVTMKEPCEGFNPYWTLLDVSCRAGAGHTDESTFVPAAFEPFKKSLGDGNGIVRKGDGVRLSYYLHGDRTSSERKKPSVYSTSGILSRKDGTGRCGGWARLLIAMFRIHGIESLHSLSLTRKEEYDENQRFLVMTCTFEGRGTATRFPGYTHHGLSECIKWNGVPGQGKTNPQFSFADHVVVEHDGNIYDPSYGLGPIRGQRNYEAVAIAGVGRTQRIGDNGNDIYFTLPDGSFLSMPPDCGPGFIEHEVTDETSMAPIATTYKVPALSLLEHPYNEALKRERATSDQLQPGDIVRIPRELTTLPILWSCFLRMENFA